MPHEDRENHQDKPTQKTEQDANKQTKTPDKQIASATTKSDVPAAVSQCCSQHKDKHWLDYAAFALELFGLAVLCIYAAYTIRIYSANKEAADAAKSAADTARQTLEVQNRPWVAATIGQKGPLHFGPNGAGIDVQFRMKNVGHTPAVDTRYHASIVSLPRKTWVAVEIRDAERKECDSFPKYFFAGSPQLLPAILPNEEPSPEWPATISAQGLRDAVDSKSKGPFRHDGYVSLYLVACAVYRTSYSPDLHRSAYGFDLGIPMGAGMWMGDLKPEGIQPTVRLVFMDSFAD